MLTHIYIHIHKIIRSCMKDVINLKFRSLTAQNFNDDAKKEIISRMKVIFNLTSCKSFNF